MDAQLAHVWQSLLAVGKTKAVGYLPLPTVKNVLNEQIDDLHRRFQFPLSTRVFLAPETCINGGAFFVFDRYKVRQLTEDHKNILERARWKSDPDYIIEKLAKNWYPRDHIIYPFIQSLFGDTEIVKFMGG